MRFSCVCVSMCIRSGRSYLSSLSLSPPPPHTHTIFFCVCIFSVIQIHSAYMCRHTHTNTNTKGGGLPPVDANVLSGRTAKASLILFVYDESRGIYTSLLHRQFTQYLRKNVYKPRRLYTPPCRYIYSQILSIYSSVYLVLFFHYWNTISDTNLALFFLYF